MNYRKNEDGSYTAFQTMKLDGSVLEATAQELDNAKAMLKQEIAAWKNFGLEEVGTFNSPGQPNGKGIIYAREPKTSESNS